MAEKVKPLHFSEAFDVPVGEADFEFFDANLYYDTRAFIDPFLIKKSSKPKERALFPRFGDYFRRAYDMSAAAALTKIELATLAEFLDIPEPKCIGLGYTEESHDGAGPGESFAKRLLEFFLENAARRFLKETQVFEDNEFNPVTLEIFVDKLGPDGVSDISANLIMDYLIEFTREQCKKYDIKTKELPLDTDGFDFESAEWRGGNYYDLPENPLRPGKPVVLVPKRFLRGYEPGGESIQTTVKGILSEDPKLVKKFSGLVGRNVEAIPMWEIRSLFLAEYGVFRRYLQNRQARSTPYDFVKDIHRLMALKTYRHMFDDVKRDEKIQNCDDLLKLTNRYLSIVDDHFAKSDGWKETWNENSNTPKKEEDIGRTMKGMGNAFFNAYPDVTFETQVNMGGGAVDFKVIHLNCRIVIELKKLANASHAGKPPLAAYLHGIQRQLPIYAYDSKANHAIYVTVQHFTASLNPKKNHDSRVTEIEAVRPTVEAEMKAERAEFQSLTYVNIPCNPRPSASKA